VTRVLVTGADGFVGRAVTRALIEHRYRVRRALRRPPERPPAGGESIVMGDIDSGTDWHEALASVDAIVHLAARVHVLHETAVDPLAAFRRVNVEGTSRLAMMAGSHGVRRFVYMSSVGVNGNSTSGRPFTEADLPAPETAYARSKWEAEQALRRVAERTGLDVVVLRPPLVYGPDVKGNFLRLVRIVDRRIPAPLACVRNTRSLLDVVNLASAIVCCLGASRGAGQTYLVRDGEDVSTPELIRRLARALGRRPRLVPCPLGILRAAAGVAGVRRQLDQLIGSLTLDDAKIRSELGWVPPLSMPEGLQAMADWYRATKHPSPASPSSS
jgi:nucleoside-diphosphate-sugar epimerase